MAKYFGERSQQRLITRRVDGLSPALKFDSIQSLQGYMSIVNLPQDQISYSYLCQKLRKPNLKIKIRDLDYYVEKKDSLEGENAFYPHQVFRDRETQREEFVPTVFARKLISDRIPVDGYDMKFETQYHLYNVLRKYGNFFGSFGDLNAIVASEHPIVKIFGKDFYVWDISEE